MAWWVQGSGRPAWLHIVRAAFSHEVPGDPKLKGSDLTDLQVGRGYAWVLKLSQVILLCRLEISCFRIMFHLGALIFKFVILKTAKKNILYISYSIFCCCIKEIQEFRIFLIQSIHSLNNLKEKNKCFQSCLADPANAIFCFRLWYVKTYSVSQKMQGKKSKTKRDVLLLSIIMVG